MLPDRQAIRQSTISTGVSGDFGYLNERCGWVNAGACAKCAVKTLRHHDGDRVKINPNSRMRKVLCGQSSDLVPDQYAARETSWTIAPIYTRTWLFLPPVHGRYFSSTSRVEQPLLVRSLHIYHYAKKTNETQSFAYLFQCEPWNVHGAPHRNNELKVGRHGFGYQNPMKVSIDIPPTERESELPKRLSMCHKWICLFILKRKSRVKNFWFNCSLSGATRNSP